VTWRDTNTSQWGGWVGAGSFPLLLFIIWLELPVEKMIIAGLWDSLLILAALLLIFCFFWLRTVFRLRKTVYKISLSDDKVILNLHFNRTIITSKQEMTYVTPYIPLSTKEIMVETANTRNKKYVIKLKNGKQCLIPYTMDDLAVLLKILSGEVKADKAESSLRDEETKEAMSNGNIYGICIIIGLVMVGGLLALTLLPFIESNYGKESAATFTAFVWLPLVIVFGPLVGMLIGYFVVKYRSGREKALEALIGK